MQLAIGKKTIRKINLFNQLTIQLSPNERYT